VTEFSTETFGYLELDAKMHVEIDAIVLPAGGGGIIPG